jgi:8-oxo-dGTP pyrophosphatase MutT (NUDIX family)
MLTCTFENGNSTQSLRHVSVGVIVIREDQILLERRAKNLSCGGKIALPGGYVDHNERISDAAIREVFEETGYRITDVTLLLVMNKLRHICDIPSHGSQCQSIPHSE